MLAVAYAVMYFRDPFTWLQNVPSLGWWSWNDQGEYQADVLAWGAGNLDPAQHYYFPGYALLAVPFLWLTPGNPFAIPDALSFLCTIILLGAWASRILPDRAWASAVSLFALFAAYYFRPQSFRVWVDPWDTTPTVPLCLACLLAALKFSDFPSSKWAFWAGILAGLAAAFRPIDAAIYGGAALLFCVWEMRAIPAKRAIWLASFGCVGFLSGAAPGIVAYLLTHGFSFSAYIVKSRGIGFDWKLLPERWVSIMIGGTPWLGGSPGLIASYPWIITGLAGILAGAIAAESVPVRNARVLLGTAVIIQIIVYLCYRDLQPTGLFVDDNQHYFKGALACLIIFTVVFFNLLRPRGRNTLIAALAVLSVGLLLPWRLRIEPQNTAVQSTLGGLLLPNGFNGEYSALWVNHCLRRKADESPPVTMVAGAKTYQNIEDFKTFPMDGGFLILPVRSLPALPTFVTFRCDQGERSGPEIYSGSYLSRIGFRFF